MSKTKFFTFVSLFLTGFLLVYHCFKLYSIYFGEDVFNSNEFQQSFGHNFPLNALIPVMSGFRILVILGAIIGLLKVRTGLIVLWAGIGMLVALQFLIAITSSSEKIQLLFSGLRPLKGLLIPSIITIISNKKH